MTRMCSVLLSIIMLLSLAACGKSVNTETALTWQEQYDLGVRYLSEGNYEEAIIAFTVAIEIDPQKTETYEKMAEAYISLGDIESAKDILEQGANATGEDSLRERFEYLQGNGSVVESHNLNIGDDGYLNDDVLYVLPNWPGELIDNVIIALPREDSSWIKDVTEFNDGSKMENWLDQRETTVPRTPFEQVVRRTNYDENGNIETHELSFRNDSMTEKHFQTYSGDWVLLHDDKYYEVDGMWESRSSSYDETGELWSYTYQKGVLLDGRLLPSKNIDYDGDGIFDEEERYEYDDYGNRIKELEYSENGDLLVYKTMQYDEIGKQLSYYYYFGTGELDHYSIFLYDKSGEFYGQDFYDKNGNLTEEYRP